MTTAWTTQTATGEPAANAEIPTYIITAVDAEAVTAVAAEVAAAAASGGALGLAVTAGVGTVAAQGVTSVAAVSAQQVTSVAAVAAQGVTSVGLVETAGTAQLALIAAANAADLYADTTAGLAGTASGSYFATPGTDGAALNYYKDNAGTAVLVAQVWGSDAANPQTLRQVQQRYDYQVSSGARDYPDLLPVRPYAWTFTGTGVRNADGTTTLGAGDTWVSPALNYAPFDVAGNLYLYIPLTTEDTDALEIKIHQAGTIVKAGNTVTQPSAGVYRQTWSNTAPLSSITITVTNVSSGSLTAFDPEVTQTDSAYLPRVLSYSDHVIVEENRQVVDWDLIAPYARWNGDKPTRDMTEASITVAFDSVSGSDAAAGTRYAPKQTLDAGTTLAQDAVVGFKRGSTWREHYPDLGSTTKGLRLRDYSDGAAAQDFPMFKGCQSLSGASWTLESGTCWKTTLTVSSAVTSYYGYDYMKVIQTTVADATAMPLGATAALTRASSKANCIATAGTFFTEDTTSTLRTVYVNPNDATIPSSSTLYTYEVTDRYCLFNWSAGNPRMQVMQGLEVYDSSFGYGAISGGPGAKFSGIIASHGGKHTLKIEAGSVRDFILYNKGNTESSSGNCYISPTGNGYTWRWTNGMAYACYPSAFYSHTAAGTFTSGEYSYIWVDGERQPNGSLILGDGFNCDSVTAVTAEWCYIKGFQRFGRAGTYAAPVNGTLKNCLIRESGIGYSWKTTEHCIIQVENQSDPDSVNNRGSIMIRVSEDHVVQNCILYAKNTDVSGYAAALSDYTATCIDPVVTGINNPNVRRNIFLVDTTLATNQTIVSEAGVISWQSDYNVFIFCAPGNISSYKSGGSTKSTIADYLSVFTGHDANSLFIDLRDDPRGAQAVFIDPENGDFRWAQTAIAEQVKAYCIANDCGPDWTIANWPTMPTVDEARKLLMKAY